jgi:hypothetical protein
MTILKEKLREEFFLHLVKNDEESKCLFKKILKNDLRERRERKKFYKSLEKLEI